MGCKLQLKEIVDGDAKRRCVVMVETKTVETVLDLEGLKIRRKEIDRRLLDLETEQKQLKEEAADLDPQIAEADKLLAS